ncbi:hypothetical protein AAMO2058_000818100 [Amorphochlora amoebiformis]
MESKTFSMEPDESDLGKQAWIEKAMQDRRSEWTEAKQLTIFCGSWNVNGKKPKDDCRTWLMPVEEKQVLPDLVCLGFQEVVDLNAQSLLVDHNVSANWQEHLGKTKLMDNTFDDQYILVKTVHLVGLLMLVYVRKNLKGRNSDFANICKRLRLKTKRAEEKIGDHNFTFWIGDLNYRLTSNDLTEVYQDIKEGNIGRLLRFDQLLIERAEKRVFQGWKEGDILFYPTYKYQTGTDLYERREDKKKRFPAWCDRIQWKLDPEVKGIAAKLKYYRRAEQKQSDHKPVMTWHDCTAQRVISKAKSKVLEDIARQFDKWENNQIPQVALNRNNLNFSDVRFERPQTEIVIVENIGKSIAQYYFASGASREGSKGWLKVAPNGGYIPPGHKVKLKINAHVTAKTASELNQGTGKLQTMLVFRLKCGRKDDLGKDYYITINGTYLRSAYGCSLEYLVRNPMPVRAVDPNTKVHPESVLTLPKELWRLVDYIYRKGMDEEDLFLTSGDENEIGDIRECLDTGRGFSSFGIHSMAEAFIQFLVSLKNPVFPMKFIDEMHSDSNLSDFCKQALLNLTPIHYNAFVYVISFLREVLKHSASNKLTADKIIPLFAKCLFHYTPGAAERLQNMRQKPYIVLNQYLTSPDFVAKS